MCTYIHTCIHKYTYTLHTNKCFSYMLTDWVTKSGYTTVLKYTLIKQPGTDLYGTHIKQTHNNTPLPWYICIMVNNP